VSEHTHTTIVPGCYRCDLNKDEVIDSATDTIKEALREYVGDGDGADETILQIHDQAVAVKAHHAGYEAARQDMVSGAFIGGPTYEALRDSFTGQRIAAEAVEEFKRETGT
jgi:hypothetical protein